MKEQVIMQKTKNIRLAIALALMLPWAAAAAQQPSWAKKSSQTVFTLKTFSADNQLTGSSCGFFVGTDGTALSTFTPFVGATRAVIIDAQGREWPVTELLGADDVYDVARFRVDIKKPSALTVATANAPEHSTLWLLDYPAGKKNSVSKTAVERVEQFGKSGHGYYTLSTSTDRQSTGCPLLDDGGNCIAIVQPPLAGSQSKGFAVSALFADSLTIGGLGLNNSALRKTGIAKAIPDGEDAAILSLFMAASALDSAQYADYVDRFIAKYPALTDGYISRARLHSAAMRYEQADADMRQAIRINRHTDDVHYQYAQLILQKVVLKPQPPHEGWTLERALEESREASRQNDLPGYRQQQASILYSMERYTDAADIYMLLAAGAKQPAEYLQSAALCRLQAGDTTAYVALTDSAVNSFGKPYPRAAARYLADRAEAYQMTRQFRKAVNDLNDYAALVPSQLTADFYYRREQAEMDGKLFKQALDDITKAIEMAPGNYSFLAEKARVELRVGMLDACISTSTACIALDAGESDGYLFLGLAQCLKKQTADGLANLQKAKELGNSQAQPLIDKYSR